jgi:tape measure domain-containing protein
MSGTKELERMVVRLIGDSSEYKKMLREAQAVTREASSAIGSTVSKMTGILKGAADAAAKIGAGIAAGATAAAGWGLKLAADAEQAHIAFTTMLGSAMDAKAMMKDLNDFAASTPFEIAGITDATKKLLAYGVAQQDIIPTLTKLGDISAALGIPLGELSDLYGKARVQGTLFAEDINQLTGRGIPVIQEFAKQLGVTESEVKKLASEGKLNFGHLQQAFTDLTSEGSMFGGLMEEQSKSLAGRWSTMKDEIALTLQELGTEIAETFDLKTVLVNLTEFFKGVRSQVGSIVDWVKELDYAIDDLALRAAGFVKRVDVSDIIEARKQLRKMDKEAAEINKALDEALGGRKIPDSVRTIKTEMDSAAMDDGGFSLDLTGIDVKPQDRDELLKTVDSLVEAGDKASEAMKKISDQASKAIGETIGSLKDEIETYGMTRKELALYEAAKLGASDAQKAVIASLHDEITAKEDAAKATDEAREAEKRFRDSIKGIGIEGVGRNFEALARIQESRSLRGTGQDMAVQSKPIATSDFKSNLLATTNVGVLTGNDLKRELLFLELIAESTAKTAEKEPVQIKSAGIGN